MPRLRSLWRKPLGMPARRDAGKRNGNSSVPLKRGAILPSEGSTIRLTGAKVLAELVEKAKANVTKAISIRLPVTDLDRAQQIAAKEGIGYQTVLKRAIRAGLKKVS